MPYTVENGTLRQTAAPPDFAAERERHAGELRNLAQQWAVPWPPVLTADGFIRAVDFQAMRLKIESYMSHERALQDRERFFDLLKRSGYI